MGEVRSRALFEQRIVKQQLDFAGPVAQLGEQHAAVVADAQHPPGHRHAFVVACLDRLRDGVARRLADGIGVDAAVLQRLELGHPHAHLFGQPRPVFDLGQVGLQLAEIGRAAVVVQQTRGDQVLGSRDVMPGVRLRVSPRERQHQETFGDHRCDADPGDQPGVLVARIARHPLGLILHVRPVQRLELPPLGEEHQQAAPESRDRACAELGALLERRPEHREVQRNPGHPNAFGLHAQLADHQFDCAVGGLGGAAHQVERCAVGAPRDQRQHRDDGVAVLDRLDQQAVAVGGVAEPAQRHREAALGFGVPPRVGPLDHLGHLLAAEVAVPSDPNGCACPPRPRHRLPHRAHVGPGEPEVVRIQDRLVAQLQRVEAGLAEGLGPRRAGTHHPGRPAVRLAQRQPRMDGLLPCLRVADGVAAGQTDTDLDAIGDRRPAVGREHDRLVAAGGEIAQRVVLAEQLEQAADRGFVLAGERVLGALRLEQHDRRDHQRQRAEQAEQRVDEDVRVAVERSEPSAGERADPVQRVGEPVFAGQRAREQFQQAPAR